MHQDPIIVSVEQAGWSRLYRLSQARQLCSRETPTVVS
jgi:hypothetical protein